MRGAIGLLVAACLATPACSAPRSSGDVDVASPRAAIATAGIGPLDPPRAQTSAALAVIRGACDQLTAIPARGGQVGAGIAASWRFEHGLRNMRMRLQPGAVFHDGAAVDAQSVAESLSRAVRPATRSPWARLLRNIEGYSDVRSGRARRLSGVRPLDSTTLEIEQRTGSADLPVVLGHPAFTPLSPRGQELTGPRALAPVCSGPYRIHSGGGWVRLSSTEPPRGRSVRVVELRELETEERAYSAYLAGQVDGAVVPLNAIAEAERLPGYARRQNSDMTYLAIDLDAPFLNDRRVRAALSLAIDRTIVIDAAFGDRRRPAVGWLGGTKSPCARWGGRVADPARAVKTLRSTGAEAREMTIPLYFDPASTSPLVAQAVQDQVGVTLDIRLDARPLGGTERGGPVGEGSILMTTAASEVPKPGGVMEAVFSSESSQNRTGFRDGKVDALFKEARARTGESQRAKSLLAAERRVCERIPAVPLWYGADHWIFRPSVIEFGDEDRIDVFGGPALRSVRLPGR